MIVHMVDVPSPQRFLADKPPLSPATGPLSGRNFDHDLSDVDQPVVTVDASARRQESLHDHSASQQLGAEATVSSKDRHDAVAASTAVVKDDSVTNLPKTVSPDALSTAESSGETPSPEASPSTADIEILQLGSLPPNSRTMVTVKDSLRPSHLMGEVSVKPMVTANPPTIEHGNLNGGSPQFGAWTSLTLDSATVSLVVAPGPDLTQSQPPPLTPLIETHTPIDDANVARVVRGIRSAINQRGGSVMLRLNPPELGFVKIQIQLNEAIVRVEITSEHPAVRTLLTQQMGQLRAALEGQGLQVERLVSQMLSPNQTTNVSEQQSQNTASDGRSRGAFDPSADGEGSDWDGEEPGQDQITQFAEVLNTVA